MEKKEILSGKNLEELTAFTKSIGESDFRARQIHNWIYLKSVSDFEQMTDLSKKTREKLTQIAVVTDVKIKIRKRK